MTLIMMATKLSNTLVAPSKVANILDWRKAAGTVMGIDITRESIGVAVAEHPDHTSLVSIPLISLSLQQDQGGAPSKKNQVAKDLIAELEVAVKRHHVCAFVVNWPTHEGRIGEQCGKVLQVLDSVIDQSNSVVTSKRPFSLWCNNASFESSPPDEWGRSMDFARAPKYSPEMRYSSKNVMIQSANASVVAANVLDDWVKNHWEVDSKIGRATAPKRASSDLFLSTHSVDEFNSEDARMQAA
mmetsp:Transcript_5909/g.14803  ORF Transcript_5909/g.14803 Transcript_5909/m.14803 type:complete len:242 (+) Transcript_5909:262-987(+)|eukprot:CAMPEP_0181115066 /NCGR_PEP_ID=MMETSP1071-20121207/21235_1 /TAXON_ID=35127 /ORGANISM="Thalassiosira sp., Strain NH16" /LENGTH=241 /DNA_ID=CAMNT_0023199251 /DNA_START=198 /DNA_END=923 /DNA_ORIENTATION=+